MSVRHGTWPAHRLGASVAVCVLTAGACVPIPHTTQRFNGGQLTQIIRGKTTSADVEAILGKPDLVWETKRVWLYDEGSTGTLLWIIPGYQAVIIPMDLPDDVLLVRFDVNDRVERVDCRVAPLVQEDFGDFLRSWIAQDGNGSSVQCQRTTNRAKSPQAGKT